MKRSIFQLACSVTLAAMGAATAFGAPYTWTGANGGATRNWFTGESGGTFSTTNFGTTSFGNGEDFVFPANPVGGFRSPTLNISYSANGISVAGSQNYTFVSSSSAVLSLGPGGITKIGSSTLNLNLPVTVTANQTWSGGGTNLIGGQISVNGTIAGSSNIDLYAGNGVTLEQNANLATYTGTMSVLGGVLNVNVNGFGGSIVSTADGLLQFGPSAGTTNQTVDGALTVGGGVEITRNLTNVQVSGPITFLDTASINMSFGVAGTAQNHSFSTPGSLDWGGAGLNLNLLTPTSGTVANLTSWDFFTFNTYSGTLSGITLSTDPSSPYGGLTFATSLSSSNIFDQRYGAGMWLSDWTTGGQRFVFNESTGVLQIVPEPSTFVFAGIGAAMLGWQTWAGRRRKARMKLIEEHTRKLSEGRGVA